jgi:hypothetical protein
LIAKRTYRIIFALVLGVTIHIALSVFFKKYTITNSLLIQQEDELAGDSLNEITYLFAGDSHPTRAIDHTKIDGAYNMSFYGENPMRTYYRLEQLFTSGKTPKYLFLQAEITRFTSDFSALKMNNYFYGKYLNEYELYRKEEYSLNELIESYKYDLVPYVEFIEVIAKSKKQKSKKDNQVFKDLKESERLTQTKSFVQESLLNGNPSNLYNNLSLQYLDKTINLCLQHNVEPIFIEYPVTAYFVNELKDFCPANIYNQKPHLQMIQK